MTTRRASTSGSIGRAFSLSVSRGVRGCVRNVSCCTRIKLGRNVEGDALDGLDDVEIVGVDVLEGVEGMLGSGQVAG